MLRPSGSLPITARSNPRLRNSAGATGVVAPFAQSMASWNPANAAASRKHGAQMVQVRDRPDSRQRTASGAPSRTSHDGSATIASTCALDVLGELLAAAREHLDAVVLERIVRRRDDDAGVVMSERARQIRHGGRRHDAHARDRGAFAASAVRQLGLDPRPGLARVAADQQVRRPVPCGRPRDQCRAQTSDRRVIEGKGAGLAAGRRLYRKGESLCSCQFFPLLMATCIVAGRIRATPARCGLST